MATTSLDGGHQDREDVTRRIGAPPAPTKILEGSGQEKLARHSLIEVIEWAIGGDDDAHALNKIQEIEETPAVAAWFARSLGYCEAQADNVAEITQLRGRVRQLEDRADTPNARLIAAVERNNALVAQMIAQQGRGK